MRHEMTPSPEQQVRPPLPEDLQSEQALLGSILLEPDSMDLIADIIQGHEFASPAHRKVYDVMSEMRDEGASIDLVTVTRRLMEKGWLQQVGGATYIAKLSGAVPTAANITDYAKNVRDIGMLRRAILETRELLEELEHTSAPAAALQKLQSTADTLADTAAKKEPRPIGEIALDCYEEVEQKYFAFKDGRQVTGIASGYPDLDKLTSGFQQSDLIIVAARPSVGKTAFALNIAQNVGERGEEGVAIFSLEMSEKQLVNRVICAAGRIDSSRFRNGALYGDDWEKVSMVLGTLSQAKIYIDDTPAITVPEIRAKCRKMKREKGIGLVIIDYLQLITGRGKRENRQQEVSEITRSLKQMARELEIPVIALSQLSRAVEQRQDKRPLLSDLRESGSLEQDADLVVFLYRDDYYDKDSEKKNIIEIIVAKQRNGPVGTVELAFLKQFNKFVSLDRSQHQTREESEGYKKPDMYQGTGR